MHTFGTKAETLEYLSGQQEEIGARILPLRYFTAISWHGDASAVWREVETGLPKSLQLIVRSSARGEDSESGSQAGRYESVVCEWSEKAFRGAVRQVLDSYGDAEDDDQFLVQPVLENVDGAGVAFTIDPNSGGNYYVINYDMTGSTSSITSGKGKENRLFYCFKRFPPREGMPMAALCHALGRLETLLGTDRLDVEFDIVFSCYTFDLPKRVQVLRSQGFTAEEVDELISSLRGLTNNIINSKTGLWRKDSDKIRLLRKRYLEVVESRMDDVEKMFWLIEDCRRYGTLPFAGLARAGFIAVQLLHSMVAEEILSREEYDDFMRDVETVGSRMKRDFARLPAKEFLRRYGHLRPGTYDITSPRYDEKPEMYFCWDGAGTEDEVQGDGFRLSIPQLERIRSALDKHGLDDDVLGLFTFIRSAIEGREMAKFIFTRSLSETLRLFGGWCARYGVSLEDSAFCDIRILRDAYQGTPDVANLIRQSVEDGKRRYEESRHMVLPPLIAGARDVVQFYVPDAQPTYVTQGRTRGRVAVLTGETEQELADHVLVIPSADPGYDWIFSHRIAGFITEYGGANSHMAIRAGELGLPAVIGAGQKLFDRVCRAQVVEIDAALQKVTVLQ